MKKHIFSRALALIMALSLLSTTAFAASFSQLQDAIDSQEQNGNTNGISWNTTDTGRNITLNDNVTYGGESDAASITIDNKNVTINMNDHIIDGGYRASEEDGEGGTAGNGHSVITVTNKGSLNVSNGTITGGNSTTTVGSNNSAGGGVYVNVDCQFSMSNGAITGNNANYRGGGIYAFAGSTVKLTDVDVTNNTAGASGGGIFLFGSSGADGSALDFSATGGSISNNTTTNNKDAEHGGSGGSGGGVAIFSGVNASFDGVTISDNHAAGDGGAIYAKGLEKGANGSTVPTKVTVTNTTISGNSSDGKGGALFYNNINRGSHLNVAFSDSTISNNTGEYGGIYVWKETEGNLTANNTCIYGNKTASGEDMQWSLDDTNKKHQESSNAVVHAASGEWTAIPGRDGWEGMYCTVCDTLLGTREIPSSDNDNNEDINVITPGMDIADEAIGTTIADQEVPLAGLMPLYMLLEELRQHEGIEDIELPEDFKWIDHAYAQAIYWGLQEELVVDTEEKPLDPDEVLTVGRMREVLVNFVERYLGLDDFVVTLEGEDDEIVFDLGERLTAFYAELEAALKAQEDKAA